MFDTLVNELLGQNWINAIPAFKLMCLGILPEVLIFPLLQVIKMLENVNYYLYFIILNILLNLFSFFGLSLIAFDSVLIYPLSFVIGNVLASIIPILYIYNRGYRYKIKANYLYFCLAFFISISLYELSINFLKLDLILSFFLSVIIYFAIVIIFSGKELFNIILRIYEIKK